MIRLDTTNPAYKLRDEVLALIKPPPGQIALSEISALLGLRGIYEICGAVRELQADFAGLWLLRRQGEYVLQCSSTIWPAIEHCGEDYLERLEAGRKTGDV